MHNDFVYLIVATIIVIFVIMVWNKRHEGVYESVYIPRMAPNQVYQGAYSPPRVWSCPRGTSGPGCPPNGNHDEEGYRYSGMEPASDHDPIDIIAPPFTDEVFALGFGMGPGLYGSGRHTSPMIGM